MNISKVIFLLAVMLPALCSAQNYNVKINDPKLDGKEILIGRCTLDGLKDGEFGAYYESQYDLYKPAEKYITQINEKAGKVEVMVIFGSWCIDSKIQVGRFFKVLKAAGFNQSDVQIIAVNREKNALTINVFDYDIQRVPTFLVFQDGKELGRIIETPKKTLERDLAKIVRKAR